MAATPTPVRRGVLGATLSETSWCSANEEIFRYPFDIEARALKILNDLLLVSTWRDEALNEAKGGILTERDLERALEEATAEVTRLLLQKLNAEASTCLLSD
ncbi:hypothetical protein ACLOJK_028839 [Asimina triloba]